MDEDSSLFPFSKRRTSFGREAGRFRWLIARFFRVFKLHLVRKHLEGFELVHTFIIEQIF
jgi:hypothetical protein